MSNVKLKPISNNKDHKWNIGVLSNSDKFVSIKTDGNIIVDMRYPKLGFNNAINRCYMRKFVYGRLLEASTLLPKGYKLKVWDAWRSFDLQKELYDFYTKKYGNADSFVSEPVYFSHTASVHTTGGAIDLTIVDENGKELDMGTKFDDFSDKAYTDYFESHMCNINVLKNRRLLCAVMTAVDFTNLYSEWWHFDYGDKFWAMNTNNDVIYEGVFEEKDVLFV